MRTTGRKMTSLGAALRAKFRTPRDAILALGLSTDLINVKHLALDAALKRGTRGRAHDAAEGISRTAEGIGAAAEGELRVALEEVICEALSGQEQQRALEILAQHLPAGYVPREEAEDEEEADRGRREASREAMRELLKARGASDNELEELFQMIDGLDGDLPRNGTAGGAGGRLADKARDRRLARDAAIERDFYALFPEAARLDGTPLYGEQPDRSIATDGAGSVASGYDYFPSAARIVQAGGVGR
jgi:hypothetical protein